MPLPNETNPRLSDTVADKAYERLGNSGLDQLIDLLDRVHQYLGFPIEIKPTNPVSTSLEYSAGVFQLPDGTRLMALNGEIPPALVAGVINFSTGIISSGTNNTFSLPLLPSNVYVKAIVEYNVNTNALNVRFGNSASLIENASIPKGSFGYRSLMLVELFTTGLGSGSFAPLTKANLVRIYGSREAEEYNSTDVIEDGDTYSSAISKLDSQLGDILTDRAKEENFYVEAASGQTEFTASMFTWDFDNSITDIQVYVGGDKQVQDQTGASAYDFWKISEDTIAFSYPVPKNTRVTIRDERTGGGAGGGGGGSISIYDEGFLISSNVNEIDFVGDGITTSLTGPGKVQVTVPGVSGGYTSLQKLVKNGYAGVIPAGSALAWQDDGTVTLADANVATLSDFAGIAASAINLNDFGYVIKSGNIASALASLGAIPGQTVYLGETAGSLTLTPPTGLTDTIFKVGRAEPPNGAAQANAVDLYLEPEIIAEP